MCEVRSRRPSKRREPGNFSRADIAQSFRWTSGQAQRWHASSVKFQSPILKRFAVAHTQAATYQFQIPSTTSIPSCKLPCLVSAANPIE